MNPGKKVNFYTLGCKLNFSETAEIARQFEQAGYARVDFLEQPDVYVINTCSVTDNADKKCRQIVRKALRHNPYAYIVIVGCYAQLKPEEIAAIPGVDMVLGAKEKFRITECITSVEKREQADVLNSDIRHVHEFTPAFSRGERTRSFLKVQDGCDYFCTFCTIPLARGKSRSHTIAQTMQVARQAAETGVKEIVLTGVNIGDFGKQHGETFLQLLQELDTIDSIERIRISSIEPNLLNDETIAFIAGSKRLAPHLHIPLQSGSDTILTLMRRKYHTELYANRIASIKKYMPDACIGVDVIVGFPSETDAHFQETYNFLNALDISYLHVFTYSERDHTGALKIPDSVPDTERQTRSKMLHILSEKKKRFFYASQIGSVRQALFEHTNDNGLMHGFTENYIKVSIPYQPDLANRIVPVRLLTLNADETVTPELLLQVH